MLPICDLFVSIQGEGKYMGVPSIFVRVSGCNLRCVFKGSVCDTPYSSFKPEKSKYTLDDVAKVIKDNPQVEHVVITGGEPMLYRDDIEFQALVCILCKNKQITIETNGSLPPIDYDLAGYSNILYSVSPKLSTSVGKAGQTIGDITLTKEMVERHDKTRINIENLSNYIFNGEDCQLKFVYSGKECIKEIESLIDDIVKYVDTESDYNRQYINSKVMLMPEGITEEMLAEKRKEIAEVCIEKGWTYTDRLHIMIWGDKRGF